MARYTLYMATIPIPRNKPKEAESLYMLKGKLYWGAEELRKKPKMLKIAGLII